MTADDMRGVVHAVCAGPRQRISFGTRTTDTAIVKTPIAGPVFVGRLGIATDDHVYEDHGGPDMALLAYPVEHYTYWRSEGLRLPEAGAFGENLTVSGLPETAVHLGDVFEVGSAVVQVCQPRTPCYKLAIRFGRRDMPVVVQDTGFTGYLLRVLTEGSIGAGDEMRLVQREPHGVTVSFAGRAVNVDRNDLAAARRVLEVASLGASVRRTLTARLGSGATVGLDQARLFGDD